MTALDNYFKAQLIISERYAFNLSQQNNRESIDSYVTCPRKLVSSCKLGTITDKLIWDILVIGPERGNTPWSVLGTFDDPADQLQTFNFLFNEILDEHAPLKTISLCLQPNSLITDEIRHLMATRCLAAYV